MLFFKPKRRKGKIRDEGRKRRFLPWVALAAFAVGVSVTIALNRVYVHSSTNESCQSCHIHPGADQSWKLSVHHNSRSGAVTGCAECHLPPRGSLKYFMAKATTGLRDVWSYLTKDSASFDWESKGQLEHAVKIVYNESCKECHKQLYPSRISQDGITAHLYYEENEQKLDLQCISCHLDVGHYDPNYKHERMKGVPQQAARRGEPYAAPAEVVAFENFTETVPGTTVSFDMKAIPGGTFSMGSPEDEPFRRDDEGPVRQVTVSPFFMGETEVTWDMYWAFYSETMTEGRTPPEVVYANNSDPDVDAVSGPTPPFGAPDQGWGSGERPGYHDDALCGRNVLPMAVEENGKEIPPAYRGRMGIRRTRRYVDALFLRGESEGFLRPRILAQVFRCRYGRDQPLCRVCEEQPEPHAGAFGRAAQSVRTEKYARERHGVLLRLVRS